MLGLGGLGAICIVNMIESLAQKLHIIILVHFGLITFRFRFGKTMKPFMFMSWGFSDVSMTPETNIIHFWRHQNPPNNSRKSRSISKQ